MPIWLNLTLGILLQLTAFIGTVLVLFFNRVSVGGETSTILVYILCIFGCGMGVRYLFRKWVPAKCPKCSGKTFCTGSRPICYRCGDCGHVHETSFSEGGHRHTRV